MTFIWLVVWLISHTPPVQMFGVWNNWGIALAVCVAIDLIGSLGANAWRRRPYYHGFGRTWEPGSGWKEGEPVDSLRQRQPRSAKPTLARVLGEVGVALVALGIVVGAAVALPVWLSRSYAIGLTAAIVIASILVLTFSTQRRRRRRAHNQELPGQTGT